MSSRFPTTWAWFRRSRRWARSRHLQLLDLRRRHPGVDPEEAFRRRVQVLREAAGERFSDIELNLYVAAVGDTVDSVDLSLIRQASGLSEEELLRLPGVLVGSPSEIAERLQRYRETFGTTYISVLEPHMGAFAEVIKHLN
ncbi:hypothetical protein ABZU76_46355 [Amycolatopsis sp. NPDC005232]|uniref:hypothetical protein n=1 Tax=Amycolatopsis sp. NPDC005232 TaxID=3157027 RepID=UPI0033A3FC3E